jgi:Cu2+-exporting ATPase
MNMTETTDERFEMEDFQAIPGKGAEATVDGRNVKIVSPGYLREQGISVDEERTEELSSQGKTIVYVLIDDDLKGAIALADIIRPESPKAVSRLKQMGVQVMMLTGDDEQVDRWVADEIGLYDYFAEVLPDEKAEKVKEAQSRGLVVAINARFLNVESEEVKESEG